MTNQQELKTNDIAAIVTAMTDAEQPFLWETVNAVLTDPGIGQVILCIEEKTNWLESTLNELLNDSRLNVVRMPLAPLGAVRNQALSYVKLPWVAYCDGDDVWCQGKTLIQRTYARTTGCDFVGADHYLANEAGRICAFGLARYIPMPSSWLVRTEIMQRYPFDNLLRQTEDGEWWVRTTGSVQRARCAKMLIRYRVRANSLSSDSSSKKRKAKIIALAELPILRVITLLLTGCMWLLIRRDEYVWLKDWGQVNLNATR